MFDFPANPSIGDASNGYIFNGVGWAGGPIAGAPTEQFFDLSGKASQDIAVPAWAQSVQLIGSCYTSVGTLMPICQVSTDGTTFFSGATQYAYGGSVLNSGTSANQQVPTNDANGLYLAFLGDASATSMPILFTAEINLTKPNASPASFTSKSYSKSYDSAAAYLYRSSFVHGYVKQATTGSALAIKALRILPSNVGTFAAGSNVKVKWLGASSDIPQANIPAGMLLQKIWGTLTGTVAIPTSSSIENAFANITVKSATSRLFVSGGCFIGAATGTLEHYQLFLQAPTGTQIQSNGGTNNPTSGIYVPLMTTGSYLHAQSVGTVIRCASRVSRGAGTNAATVNSGWLAVEEVSA